VLPRMNAAENNIRLQLLRDGLPFAGPANATGLGSTKLQLSSHIPRLGEFERG
jgi:hypothetical protein